MGADQTIDWHGAAASAVDWWIDAGVDALVGEEPRDWLAAPTAPAAAAQAADVTVAEPAVAPLPDTLEAVAAWRIGPDAPEAGWPGSAIAAAGDPASPLFVLVDLPEREDAATGVLMSGPVGRLFDRMLAAIGHDRGSIYLVPLCAKRPVAGRVAPEIEARLAEVARHHVALAAPNCVLLLGNAPSRALTGMDVAPGRGSLHRINPKGTEVAGESGDAIEAVASFHPRFLLERPAMKAEAWKDLQMLIGGLRS